MGKKTIQAEVKRDVAAAEAVLLDGDRSILAKRRSNGHRVPAFAKSAKVGEPASCTRSQVVYATGSETVRSTVSTGLF
ncbi:MAG TPA: hypothetical protein VNW97_12410 [Candidatus Saccharimonadales bacterium]|nr:hypothetical protein [Candidatus Saccharimonadales bacterium]